MKRGSFISLCVTGCFILGIPMGWGVGGRESKSGGKRGLGRTSGCDGTEESVTDDSKKQRTFCQSASS